MKLSPLNTDTYKRDDLDVLPGPFSRPLEPALFDKDTAPCAQSTPPAPPLASSGPTTFYVTSGSNENYFYRDNITSGQLLLTSPSADSNITRRLVVALPAGNNGALVYFLPKAGGASSGPELPWAEALNVQLVNGTMKSAVGENGNAGIQADLSFTANATLGVTIVGAVRAMRDYVEGSGTMHEIFNYTLHSFNSTEVRLHRQYINSTNSSSTPAGAASSPRIKSVDLFLSIPPGSTASFFVTPSTNGTFTPPSIDIVLPSITSSHAPGNPEPRRQNSTMNLAPPPPFCQTLVRVKVLTNETSLPGLDVGGLFMEPEDATTDTLRGVLQSLPENVTDQVSFLTFTDKFTAGGWRFLTYFGRDSLVALRMLMPLLTSDAIEAALGAVIERANSTGALCHEETIGDYASFVNIGNGQPELGNTPFYDYKMIDTDLLLLPAIAHYFLELPQGQNRSCQFLAKQATLQNGTYAEIVKRIASYNINRALPFFLAQNLSVSNLIALRPGQPVGNWRDSNQGLGYGTIPFDVNVALVPANLRAVESLLTAGVFNLSDIVVDTPPQGGLNLTTMAQKWEADAPGMFEVTVDADTAAQRLESFVQAVSLNASLLGNSTSSTSKENVSFYALSLMPDGTPVEVLNSDLGFNLMYGTNVSATFLERVVDALTPYPRGLLTNIGMIVANPAYDTNTTNVQVLDRTAYHGTVVWSFQQALMAGGLARQLGFCSTTTNSSLSVDINPPPSPQPQWCSDSGLVQRLQAAQTRLWDSIGGASENIYSEVWSYSFDNDTNSFSTADIALLSPTGTESDAIQLWSYGFLGLIAPKS